MSAEDSLLNAIHVISDSFGENFDPLNFSEMVELTKAYYKDRRQFRQLLNDIHDDRGRTHLISTVRNGNITWARKIIQLLDDIDTFTIESKQFMGKECYICYESFGENEIVYKLPCRGGHIFHKNCIDKWVNINSSCPYCRDKISIENITGFLNKSSRTAKSVLYYAIKLGNLPFVDELIEKGAMVQYQNASPIHLAAGFNHKDLVTHFLGKGEDIDSKNIFNQTPLYYACRYAGPEIIQHLLENGANYKFSYVPDDENSYEDVPENIEETALHVAVALNKQYPKSIEYLIQYFKNNNLSIDEKNSYDNRPIALAIRYKNFDGVKLLVEAGSDITTLNKEHPLFCLIRRGRVRLDQEDERLLNRDEYADEEDEDYMPPPNRIPAWKERDIFRYLLKKTDEKFVEKKEFLQFVTELFAEHEENTMLILLKEYTFEIPAKSFHALANTRLYPFLEKYKILDRLIEYPDFLFEAVKANNHKILEYYTNKAKDINISDEIGNRLGNFVKDIETLRVLNTNKYDFSAINSKGENALHSYLGHFTPFSTPTYFLSYEHEIKKLKKAVDISSTKINRILMPNEEDSEEVDDILPIPVPRINRNGTRAVVKKVVSKYFKKYDIQENIIRALVDCQGINVNAKTNEGYTPLQILLHHRPNQMKTIIEILLNAGADINESSQYYSPLHIALLNKEITKEVLYYLIEKDANIHTLFDDESILHYAIHSKDEKLVRLLIEKGIDVNIKNKRGETALLHAFILADKKLDTICNLLIEKGANLKEAIGGTNINTLFRNAVKTGNILLLKQLIELGANIHEENEHGYTPIFHWSWPDNRFEVLKFLLECGSDINHKSKDGTTLLDSAALDDDEGAKILIEYGADVNIKDNCGRTPLFNAVGNVPPSSRSEGHRDFVKGQMNTVKLLVEKGANVNERNDAGETPIFQSPNIEITKYLIEKGADINAVDLSGRTLLFNQIYSIHAIEFREFMDLGLKINTQDNRGYTALHEAIVKKKQTTYIGGVNFVDFMISHGADPYIKTNDGLNAIELAKSLGKHELFRRFQYQFVDESPSDEETEYEEEVEEESVTIEFEPGAREGPTEIEVFLDSNHDLIQSINGIVRVGRRNGRLQILNDEINTVVSRGTP